MKKHEFTHRDGMSSETSTPLERMAIHRILEAKGYNVSIKTADRHPTDWDSSFAFQKYNGILSWIRLNYVINDHTYKKMLEILHHPEDWEPNTIAGAFSISKKLLKEKGLKIDSNGKIVEAIPTIELKGIRKDINFVAKDGDGDVYFYDSKPIQGGDFWIGIGYYHAECLDQSIFKDLDCLDWKESLHKVIHV